MKKCSRCFKENEDYLDFCQHCHKRYGPEPKNEWWKPFPWEIFLIGAVVVGAIVLGVIDANNKKERDEAVAIAKGPEVRKQNKYDAYGMATEFVRRQLGWPTSAKFEMDHDMTLDAGDNYWTVAGWATWEGMHKRWAMQIRYNGSTWECPYGISITNMY